MKLVRELIRCESCNQDELHHGLLNDSRLGRADCAASILEAGISPDILDPDENTPLILASGNGHAVAVELLILWDCNVKTKCGPDQNTALHAAAESGYLECCRLLVDAGADINSLVY